MRITDGGRRILPHVETLACFYVREHEWRFLVRRPGEYDPYVVCTVFAWPGTEDIGEWSWGHYFAGLEEAQAYFKKSIGGGK